MLTDGYGMTSNDYQSDLDRAIAMPLPMDEESDFENFNGDSDVEIVASENGSQTLESHKIDPDVITAGQQVSGTLENASQSGDADLIESQCVKLVETWLVPLLARFYPVLIVSTLPLSPGRRLD